MPQSILVAPRLEHKNIRFQLKALDDAQGIIEGYGSVFNNIDQGKDRVKSGAFTRTIKNAKSSGRPALFKMLWQHDATRPIGIWIDASEDTRGLYLKGQINLETQLGREAYALIAQGAVDELSIGYDAIKSSRDPNDKSVRNLEEIRLWEVSPVTFAMNEEAIITGVKNAQAGRKDFNSHYQEACINDLLSDLWLPFSSLRAAIMDAFSIGDQPSDDVSAALAQFNTAIMDWVSQGISLSLTDYLNAPDDNGNSNSVYELMSTSNAHGYKDGRMFSADNVEKLSGHVDNIKALATQANTIADDLSMVIGRRAYADPNTGKGNPRSNPPNQALAPGAAPMNAVTSDSLALSTEEQEYIKLLKSLKAGK